MVVQAEDEETETGEITGIAIASETVSVVGPAIAGGETIDTETAIGTTETGRVVQTESAMAGVGEALALGPLTVSALRCCVSVLS